MDEDTYVFKIGAYSPTTIPMARLAEYMAEIAAVYGEAASVHFHSIRKGSVNLVSTVQREAIPKVRDNVQASQWPESRTASALAYRRINAMLRADNATGELRRGRAKVLLFPGRDLSVPDKMGPFNQAVSRDGVLVRIGGKDSTAHAMLQSSDGEVLSFEVSRDLAVRLAHHLFGDPIRLSGQGRVTRNQDGTWEYLALRATDFAPLSGAPLVDVVAELRAISAGTQAANIALRLRDDEKSSS
jgi:hypothetical protein